MSSSYPHQKIKRKRLPRPYCKYNAATKMWCIITPIYERELLHHLDKPSLCSPCVEGWYYLGRPHRIGRPAIICSGFRKYFHMGKLHRDDGPAVLRNEFSIGRGQSKEEYWWAGSGPLSKLTWLACKIENISIPPILTMSDVDIDTDRWDTGNARYIDGVWD